MRPPADGMEIVPARSRAHASPLDPYDFVSTFSLRQQQSMFQKNGLFTW